MPYEKELANKTSHRDFVQNPEVLEFLDGCEYLTEPGENEAKTLVRDFRASPILTAPLSTGSILATDGSTYEAAIQDQLPNSRLGYLKIGAVLFDMKDLSQLRKGPFVDPFKVAALQDSTTALTFVLPSANVIRKGKSGVRESFRAALDEQLLGEKTRFDPNDPNTSLRSTLFQLASRRPGAMGTGDPTRLKLHSCPSCNQGPVELLDIPEEQLCPQCKKPVYPSDCLRIWEDVNDYQSNQVPLSRLMMVLEHLIPIHYIRFINERARSELSKVAFFVDGPLAVYGNPAWLHRSIMIYLHEVNSKLAQNRQPPMVIIGLQKTGQIVDHARLIGRYLENDRLFAINDQYRYKYILSNQEPSKGGFGFETYYGQDFIFKTKQGRLFVFALPYPYPSKEEASVDFVSVKTNWEIYPTLPTAIQLIEDLQTELYQDAVIPIALAHRFTAISLRPGGRVLDLLTRKSLA